MGQPLHLRGCLLLAAASYGAAPDARARPAVRRVSFSTMATRPAAALQQLHCRHPCISVLIIPGVCLCLKRRGINSYFPLVFIL